MTYASAAVLIHSLKDKYPCYNLDLLVIFLFGSFHTKASRRMGREVKPLSTCLSTSGVLQEKEACHVSGLHRLLSRSFHHH